MPHECLANSELTTIIAIGAFIISIISLVSTIVFSWLQVMHNRNSVRPISHIKIGDYESELFVEIHNVGTGPLTIKSFKAKNVETSHNNLYSLMPSVSQNWNTFTEDIEGRTIPVNGKIVLVSISPESEEIKTIIRRALSEIKIELEYVDIYNRKFNDERMLDFFSRTLIS